MQKQPTFNYMSSFLIIILFLCCSAAAYAQGNGNGNSNGNAWGTQGNSGQGNWLGTTDNTDLILKAFGSERLRLKANGGLSANGRLRAGGLEVIGVSELDSVKATHIRTNRLTSQFPGDTLIFFGDSTIVIDHANNHVYVSEQIALGESTTDKNISLNCQQAPIPTPAFWKNHTILNQYEGRVGIGTASPAQKLHVDGNTIVEDRLSVGTTSMTHRFDVRNSSGISAIRVLTDNKLIAGQLTGSGSTARVYFGDANHYIGSEWGMGLSLGTFGAEDALTIQEGSGRVVIGEQTIVNGPHADSKLSVDGKIVARELFVHRESSIWGWPDYVFEDDYELRSIEELKEYVMENKHLPGVVDAKTVQKDGIGFSTTAVSLLEKIEELSLYVILLNDKVKELEHKLEERK